MCKTQCGGVTVFKGETGASGAAGTDGVGIESTVDNGDGTFTITYTDATTFTTSDLTGPQGPAGTIPGGGDLNYVAKWTPDGTSLGNSLIQDNNTSLGVNSIPLVNHLFHVKSNTDTFGVSCNSTSTSGSTALFGYATGVTSNSNFGVSGTAGGSSSQNYGVKGSANNVSTGQNVGGFFGESSGVTNYSVKLQDGTETLIGGGFLRDMGGGNANWTNITSADTTGYTGSYLNGSGQTVTVVNGLITTVV